MLKIEENKDEIIIRDIPVVRWFISAGIAFIMFLVTFIDFSFNKKSLSDLAGVLLISSPIAGFLFCILTYPATTTKIDGKDSLISIRKRSLIKYTFNVYSFAQIADPIVVKEFAVLRGNTSYQLILSLKNDAQIELSVSADMHKEPLNDTADLMKKYIFNKPAYGH